MITVEDKDPQVLWAARSSSMMARWMSMLAGQKRWQFVNLHDHEVLHFYRELLNKCLPRSMLPNIMHVDIDSFPYAYPTVKSKCYSGNISDKDGLHSCKKKNRTFVPSQHHQLRTIARSPDISTSWQGSEAFGQHLRQWVGRLRPHQCTLRDSWPFLSAEGCSEYSPWEVSLLQVLQEAHGMPWRIYS